MSDPKPTPPPPAGDQPIQRFSHNPTSARVPDRVARGAVATGFLAFFGPNEFVIDFLQLIARPANLVTRVVMTPMVAEQLLAVLKENLGRYTAQFGQPPPMPKPNAEHKPKSPQEIYDELKIPDEVLSGVYANTVMVGHTPAEFGIDFITSFIPHASVAARVYVAAPRIPQLIETLSGLITQFHRQRAEQSSAGGKETPPRHGFGTAPGIPGFPTPPQ